MEKLFGVPLSGIMLVLSIMLGVVLLILLVLGLRHIVLVKLGLRNIPRRKAQTSLIIVGLMLSTLIITASLGVGDTVAYSIKDSAVTNLGNLDIHLEKTPNPAAALLGDTSSNYFKPEEYDKLKGTIDGSDKVKIVVPTIFANTAVTNQTSKLTKSESLVAALPDNFDQAWGTLKTAGGKNVSMADLAPGEVYTTREMTKQVSAKPGDEIKLYIEKKPFTLKVKDTLDLDIGGSAVVAMRLEDFQQKANRAGQISQIWISLKGNGGLDNVQYSDEVTRYLRASVANEKAMTDLKALLNQSEVKDKLKAQVGKLQDADPSKQRMTNFLTELDKDGVSDDFKRLSQDTLVTGQVVQLAGKLTQEQAGQLFRLSSTLSPYRVVDDKASAIDIAELVGSQFTAFLTIFALFSISVGILLIFLIFVMLAAERKAEMGMARALGIKRRHLTEMFVFEGTIYSMMAAFVGVLMGIAVGVLMVQFMSGLINSDNFKLKNHVEPRSLVIAFCIGMILTFIVVSFSAYRVSRLNIVSAIRDLEEEGKRGKSLGYIMLRPFRVMGRSFQQLFKLKPLGFLRGMTLDLTNSFFGIFWALFARGPLCLLLGYTLASAGVSSLSGFLYTSGVSFIMIGLGLTLRWVMQMFKLKRDLADRIGYSLAGTLLVVFWARPFGSNFFENLLGIVEQTRVKEIDTNGIELFFVSGIMLVAGTIWVVMFNSDLIVKGFMLLAGGIGRFAPVARTALAYPLASKFRTGMLLAMFSLVTFVIIFMSVFVDLNNKLFDDKERASGGWELQAFTIPANPVDNMKAAVAANPTLNAQINAVGSTVEAENYQMLQVGGKNAVWGGYPVQAADDEFFHNSRFKFSIKGDGYSSDQQILEAIRTQPNLAALPTWVINASAGGGGGGNGGGFGVNGIDSKAKTFKPFEVQVRDASGNVSSVTVIGFVDKPAFRYFSSLLMSRKTLSALSKLPPEQLKPSSYFYSVKNGVDIEAARVSLGQAFAENGLEPKNIAAEIKKDSAIGAGFNTLFQFFAGLGLLVGIAGLGVISTRVVVERRQQIGMMRAIGYSRNLVQASFLLESSFIAILGLLMGAVLGLWSAYRFTSTTGDFQFEIPWFQVIIILVGSYLATLLTTYLPAHAASKVYPAEALRYE